MDKLFLKLKGLAGKNRHLTYVMAAVVSCLIVLSGLLLFMPEGYAAPGDTYSEAREIDVSAGTYPIETGKYYKIPSGTYTSGITFDVVKNTGQDVYIILDNVNFTITSDSPAISFKCEESGDSLSSDPVNIHIMLVGSSQLNCPNNVYKPIIEAENYSYATEKYIGGNVASSSDPVTTVKYYSQNISLVIEEEESGQGVNSLTITTPTGSYGAGIGSGEAQTVLQGLKIDNEYVTLAENLRNLNTSTSNKIWPWGDDGEWINRWYYRTGEFLKAEVELKFGAAPVVINSGTVNIWGGGCGAAIGNGGCANSSAILISQQIVGISGDRITPATKQNTGKVNISNGTVGVVMSQSSKGSCFVNGSFGGEVAADGLVTIDGGSVYLKRQCDYSDETVPYEPALNSAGKKLYLYVADYQTDLDSKSRTEILADEYQLINIYAAEEDYKYTVLDFKNRDTLVTDTFAAPDNYLKTNVSLGSENPAYGFNGYFHSSSYSDGVGRLYFYLPSERLNSYKLTIRDNCSQVRYGTYISDRRGGSNGEILAVNPYSDYIRDSLGIYVKETKYVIIKASNVPDYCESITVTDSLTTDPYTVLRDGLGNFYVCLNAIAGNTVCTFTYNMGQYNINYDYGLLSQDSGAPITNNNAASADCGTEVSLAEPVWNNHKFEGWYLDSGFTQPVTAVSSTTVGETITVYAKWSCKVTYFSEEGTLEGAYEYTVPYGSAFDILTQAPEVTLQSDVAALIEFEGWKLNGNIYTEGGANSPVITVSQNVTINAQFKRSGYYVYITAAYGNESGNRDIEQYAGSFGLIYANYTSTDFGSDIYGDNYYRTVGFVDRTQPATVNIVPRAGWKIVSKSVVDKDGNPVNLISNDNSLNQFSFNMPDQDIYISVKFDVETYEIKYYDTIDGELREISGMPNPDEYTINTESFTFTKPDTDHGKYWKFKGFKELGRDTVITGIEKGTLSKNLTLIATWEEVDLYDIVIEENDMGTVKAYVDGVQVTKAAEGENVTLVATAGAGIKLKKFGCSWVNDEGSSVVLEQSYDEEVINDSRSISFEMPASQVNASGEFDAVTYSIMYLNLHNAENDNPSLYTIFDSFNLTSSVKDGWTFKGWKLITPNGATEDLNDVTMTDITRIENMYGNLMIYAVWEEDEEETSLYHAFVDENIVNGQVELTKTQAALNEYVFVKAQGENGYKLTSLTYNAASQSVRAYSTSLVRSLAQISPSIDISMNQVADGVYYLVMPDNDVEVTARFEPITYNILYNTDGGIHTNKTRYTVEDDIALTSASRDGYNFAGWFDSNGNRVESIHSSVGDIVLVAQWEKIPTDNCNSTDSNGDIDNDNDGGNADSNTGNDSSSDSDVNTETRPNSYVSSGGIKTGDDVNVMRLVIICVICGAVMLLLLIPKKKKKDEDEEEITEHDKEEKQKE